MKFLCLLTIVNVASGSLPEVDEVLTSADVQLLQATLSVETKPAVTTEDRVKVKTARTTQATDTAGKCRATQEWKNNHPGHGDGLCVFHSTPEPCVDPCEWVEAGCTVGFDSDWSNAVFVQGYSCGDNVFHYAPESCQDLSETFRCVEAETRCAEIENCRGLQASKVYYGGKRWWSGCECGGWQHANSNWLVLERAPTPACEIERNYDYLGSDDGRQDNVESAEECAALCYNRDGCKAFTYGKKEGQWYNKICFFKNAVKAGRHEDACCDSGLPSIQCQAKVIDIGKDMCYRKKMEKGMCKKSWQDTGGCNGNCDTEEKCAKLISGFNPKCGGFLRDRGNYNGKFCSCCTDMDGLVAGGGNSNYDVYEFVSCKA